MTIELPAQLETVLSHEAQRRGTTPQALAVQLLESHLLAPMPDDAPPANGAVLNRWREHFESLPPPSTEPRPEWLRADNVSEAFGKILEQRRTEGRS